MRHITIATSINLSELCQRVYRRGYNRMNLNLLQGNLLPCNCLNVSASINNLNLIKIKII